MKNSPALLDQCWKWLIMMLVCEDVDKGNKICGTIISLHLTVDLIRLWMCSKDGIGCKLVKLHDVSNADGIGLESQVSSWGQ
jgi:translation initiation factor 4E